MLTHQLMHSLTNLQPTNLERTHIKHIQSRTHALIHELAAPNLEETHAKHTRARTHALNHELAAHELGRDAY